MSRVKATEYRWKEGITEAEKKRVLGRKASGTPGIPRLTNPKHRAFKPRVEEPGPALERILDAYAKWDEENKDTHNGVRCREMRGRVIMPGWRVLATTRHWAVCEKGTGEGEPFVPEHGEESWRDLPLGIQAGLMRAGVVAGKQGAAYFEAHDGTLLISADGLNDRSREKEVEFVEEIPFTGADGLRFAANISYLSLAMGCEEGRGMRISCGNPDEPVILQPWDASWRLVLMPLQNYWRPAPVWNAAPEVGNGK